jgi:metal-dependent amidase/aminoacylase/carboxypeptidase family protein
VKIWLTPKPALLGTVTILEEAFGTYAMVSTKMPARNRPERFVRVSRTGGGQDNPVTDRARILVECFAKDTAQAEAMCNTARAALRNACSTFVAGMFVRWYGNESGPVDLAHPDIVDMERWQFSGEIWMSTNRDQHRPR